MKRIISLLLSLILIISALPFSVMAEDNVTIDYESGDVSLDGVIDAEDALLILKKRSAAC